MILNHIKGLSFVLGFMLVGESWGSLYQNDKIPDHCHTAYQKGVEDFNQSIQSQDKDPGDRFNEGLKTVSVDCQETYSLGVYEARALATQKTLLEFLLEQEETERAGRHEYIRKKELIQDFSVKLSALFQGPELLSQLGQNPQVVSQFLQNFKQNISQEVKKRGEAIQFGRFIFTNYASAHPFTAFEYERDNQGLIKRDENNDPVITMGTYQLRAQEIIQRAEDLYQVYLDWRPGVFFDQDSFWYGSFRRLFKKEKSLRELKEENFEAEFKLILKNAESLNLEMAPFFDMMKAVNQKRRQMIQRDLSMFYKLKIALISAPMIPLGMAFGAGGFASLGLTQVSAKSFVLAGGSFWSSSNVAALTSFSAIAGFAGMGTYQVIKEALQGDRPFKLSHALDVIVGSTIQSFPLAFAAPIAFGRGGQAVKSFAVNGWQVITQSWGGMQKFAGLGLKEMGVTLAKLPVTITRQYLKAWWKKQVLHHLFIDLTICYTFEIASREFILGGDSRFFLRDEKGNLKINENALFSMTQAAIIYPIAAPINFIPNLALRWMAWRALGFGGGMVTSALLNDQMNWKRIKFDAAYHGTASTAFGELERSVRFSSFTNGMSMKKQTILLTVFGLGMKAVKRPVYNHVLDKYMETDQGGFTPYIREFFSERFQLDFSDYSDEEIYQAFTELFEAHPDFPGPSANLFSDNQRAPIE